jgi:hypothetical protein
MRLLFTGLCALVFTFSLTAHSAQAEWTWLIFLNGKNDLEPHADETLSQLQPFASNPKVNVLVQVGKLAEPTVKRLRVVTDPKNPTAPSPILEDLGPVDMGDYRSVIDFITWGVQNFPAHRYHFTFWDHGTGWHDIESKDASHKLDEISHDEITDHSITTKEMRIIFKTFSQLIGRKIDIISNDACYMGSLEVAYELAPYADYYLGSEDIEPVTGWPYHRLMKKLAANPRISPLEFGNYIATQYLLYQSEGTEVKKREVTFSIYQLAQFAPFVAALRDLSEVILRISPPQQKVLQQVGTTALHLTQKDYVDFGSWLDKAKGSNALRSYRSHFEKVERAYTSLVIVNNYTSEWEGATGASIWLPNTKAEHQKFASKYDELQFTPATRWGEVVESLSTYLPE